MGDEVVGREGADRPFIKERIADFKLPRRIEFVSSLPKTATGKIQKLRLRQEVCDKERLDL